jgi:uncharacterized protein YjbI with pentapeptide repeats
MEEDHKVEQHPSERALVNRILTALGAKPREWTVGDRRLAILAIIIVLAILLTAVCGYVFGWGWTGLTKPKQRTFWDWLDLLIVPVVLALGGYLFNRSENRRTQEIADQHAKTDRAIAERRIQDDTLQAYLDHMGQLLLDKDNPLRQSGERDEVRTLALARTLTVLRRLDGERNGRVLQFLHDSYLVTRDHPILSFAGANLRADDLSEANLLEADLSGAKLMRADLRGAILIGANLRAAILRGALLSHAILSGVDLRGANLIEADLRGAILTEDLTQYYYLSGERNYGAACLQGAMLSGANLSGANLSGANLKGAILSGADLSGANLTGAVLSGAVLGALGNREVIFLTQPALQQALLREVSNRGANLSGADLSDAKVMSNKQLERQVASLKGTTMPDGKKYEDWVKNGRPARRPRRRSRPQ